MVDDEHAGGAVGESKNAPEIGISELRALVGRSWKLIALWALIAGLVAAIALGFLVPTLYLADAKLLVTPLTQGYEGSQTRVDLYGLLATSDGVVERATVALIEEGTLSDGAILAVGRELELGPHRAPADRESVGAAFLTLRARHREPQRAAAIVNAWARVVVDEGRSMFRSTAAGSEQLLESQLDPTNIEIEAAGAELSESLDDLAERKEEATTGWDRRVFAAKTRAADAVAAYHTATRQLMNEAADRLLPSDAAPDDDPIRLGLREIVSVRTQLARTPRVLRLETAASSDTLLETLAEGEALKGFDNTLVTQEMNPLYDQLTLRVLGLESRLKGRVGDSSRIAVVLAELERIQLERSAGLRVLEERRDLELRVLQLRRRRAIDALQLENLQIRADYNRKLEQLTILASELSQQLSRSVVSRVLDDVELIRLAVPASAPRQPIPRQAIIKVAVATFLGGLLGLMIALFRSADRSR